MKIFKSFVYTSAIAAILFSCSMDNNDYGLSSSTYVSDPVYTELPAYSEWGLNTFGAYYDRESFVSNNQIVPLKVEVKNDTTFLNFSGDRSYGYSMTLTIGMTDVSPNNYEELHDALKGKTLDLTSQSNFVKLNIQGNDIDVFVLEGTMEVIKAQNLIVDQKPEGSIISGVFQMKLLVADKPVAITNGRYDVIVGYNNFFNY